jgi:uncharacterized membrane protein
MVVMALDHTRDYFHAPAFLYDPANPAYTTIPIYLTRWITHFCAPVFSFLAGASVFFVGRRKSKQEVSIFLLKRGLWLVFIELTVVNFAWYFDPSFKTPGLFVIWVLGISMIILAALIYLPRSVILWLSCLAIVGHHLLDHVPWQDNMLWSVLHVDNEFDLGDGFKFYVSYPIIPWFAVMSLGYYFGSFYDYSFNPRKRKSILNITGICFIFLFLIIRGINEYGDLLPWEPFESMAQTAMSFMNPTKYPPSLSYILMTLGPSLILMANSESWKGKLVDFLQVFGRVPFFYYILHLYLIHLLALLAAELTGSGWELMILSDWVTEVDALKGYGFNLLVTYGIWMFVVLSLYPLCRWFDRYKSSQKHKWWLSYL